MFRISAVMLLLITGMVSNAAAGDGLEDPSKKKAKKIITYLAKVGLNNPRIVAFANTVGDRVEDGKFRLAEEQYEVGRVVFFYEAKPKMGTKYFQLKFQPSGYSNTEFTATTKSLMMNYKYSF
jgi:hypothetical protein